MKTAYNSAWLYNLAVVNETKRWLKHQLIGQQQFERIQAEYHSSFYHPSFIIRVLLFIASSLALLGIIGLAVLLMDTSNEKDLAQGAIVYAIVSFFVLEIFFIKNHHHFKSGVTEALLYFAIGFLLMGFIALFAVDNIRLSMIASLFVFSVAAIRYTDLVSTIFAIGSFCYLLFFQFYELEGVFRSIIPFVFILVFLPLYWVAKKLRQRRDLFAWRYNLLIVESASVLLVYAGGNYLVVRELSESMMNMYLEEGYDIPFAIIFYVLTATTPIIFLYWGIKTKDKVLIRISLLLVALSAFTFKYYFSFGHPEITLTIAGVVVLVIAIFLLHYLKVFRYGYTREKLLSEKWADLNLEALIISQTMGGNQVNTNTPVDNGGGGQFGGAGSSDRF